VLLLHVWIMGFMIKSTVLTKSNCIFNIPSLSTSLFINANSQFSSLYLNISSRNFTNQILRPLSKHINHHRLWKTTTKYEEAYKFYKHENASLQIFSGFVLKITIRALSAQHHTNKLKQI
jgi:hypothetical protein